jgi:predicted metal-dependent enzyme (double-stranded beta helix superfamily)
VSNDPAITLSDTRFIDFVTACEQQVAGASDPIATRDAVAELAAELARKWQMPDPAFRKLQPGAPYSSYQLYLNSSQTLSVILDIFAPGQVAPVHNHCCWGVFVCLEGRELERRYDVPSDLSTRPVESQVLDNGPGVVSVAGPQRNAFHQVECVGDVPAVSLHVYGANLKALQRDRWDEVSASYVSFCSGADPHRRQDTHYLTPEGLNSLSQLKR